MCYFYLRNFVYVLYIIQKILTTFYEKVISMRYAINFYGVLTKFHGKNVHLCICKPLASFQVDFQII